MTTLTRAAASAPAATTEQRLNGLLLRKLMPLLIVVYVMSFLDRTNIALAKAAWASTWACQQRPMAWGRACSSLPMHWPKCRAT